MIVRDDGVGITEQEAPTIACRASGLPVIRALSERAEFRVRPSGGTEVWMVFAGERGGQASVRAPARRRPG